ncbi:MAG: cytochrome c3 family protein [Ignavibacteriaceae bacterium]
MKIKTIKNIFFVLMVFLSYTAKIHAQISPGDLTFAHSKLEGLSNCTKCHVLGKQVEASRCLACHTEIKTMIDKNEGYHSSQEVRNKNCWDCHSEHHGRSFMIINFYPDKFDHDKAGFKLEGKHSEIKCVECHQTKFISNSLFRKRQDTFLGLSTTCISCHEDVHQNTLGKDCGSCHNSVKFKPAPFFNHNNTKFKLIGAHAKVECSKCHITEKLNGKIFQKFTGLQFKNCTPCHQDVHKGTFGSDCVRCHNVESFKVMNKNSFDHSKTKFPLEGAHENVKCSGCHGTNLLSKPKFAKCTDCHKDYHFGEFTVNNVVRDCKDCHSVDSFKITLYTTKDHNKIKFQLTGAHLAVPCQSCHYKDNVKAWHFRNIGLKCFECHENIHGTELTKKFMPDNNCTSCHVTDDWRKISFDHDRTNFKLLGKHKSITCVKCHAQKEESGKVVYKFVSLQSNCITCHRDIHFGQFNAGNNSVCENCHGFDNWKPVKFDHEKTGFPLKGAHEKVPCSGCHKEVNVNGNLFIKYKMEEFKCASCHA